MNNDKSHHKITELPLYGVLAVESAKSEPFTVAHHSHEHFQLLYVQSGEVLFSLKHHNEVKTLGPGSVACVAQGIDHYVSSQAAATFSLLAISADFCHRYSLDMAWAHLASWGGGSLDPIQTQEVARRFQRILFEQTHHRTARDGIIIAEALLLIGELARSVQSSTAASTSEEGLHTNSLRHVLSLMEERLYEPWDLDMAAERCHLSRRQFTTVFKAHTGQSFLSYLTTLRLQFAKKLLRREGANIIGVAFSSGFSDLSHFYRLFKKEYGITPGAWIKERDES